MAIPAYYQDPQPIVCDVPIVNDQGQEIGVDSLNNALDITHFIEKGFDEASFETLTEQLKYPGDSIEISLLDTTHADFAPFQTLRIARNNDLDIEFSVPLGPVIDTDSIKDVLAFYESIIAEHNQISSVENQSSLLRITFESSECIQLDSLTKSYFEKYGLDIEKPVNMNLMQVITFSQNGERVRISSTTVIEGVALDDEDNISFIEVFTSGNYVEFTQKNINWIKDRFSNVPDITPDELHIFSQISASINDSDVMTFHTLDGMFLEERLD